MLPSAYPVLHAEVHSAESVTEICATGRGAPSEQSELESLSRMQNAWLCIRSEIFQQGSFWRPFYSKAGLLNSERAGREAQRR